MTRFHLDRGQLEHGIRGALIVGREDLQAAPELPASAVGVSLLPQQPTEVVMGDRHVPMMRAEPALIRFEDFPEELFGFAQGCELSENAGQVVLHLGDLWMVVVENLASALEHVSQ